VQSNATEAIIEEATLVARHVSNEQIVARLADELGRGVIGADVNDPAATAQPNVDSLADAVHLANKFPVSEPALPPPHV
jgi:hypothetical protein